MSDRKYRTPEERQKEEIALLAQLAAKHQDFEKLLHAVNDKWVYEDSMYRFYHQSFKVYHLQEQTLAIVEMLQSLAPHLPLNNWFMQIVASGTGKEFKDDDNLHWPETTRPILEAFLHARYFLEMVCKYGNRFKEPPTTMPSGWAAFLYLFNIR